MFKINESDVSWQFSRPWAVNVRVIGLPSCLSKSDGTYVGFSDSGEGINSPDPELVQL